MNNINLCYYKKFTTNYGDSFYICKKCQCNNSATILAISVHILDMLKLHVC